MRGPSSPSLFSPTQIFPSSCHHSPLPSFLSITWKWQGARASAGLLFLTIHLSPYPIRVLWRASERSSTYSQGQGQAPFPTHCLWPRCTSPPKASLTSLHHHLAIYAILTPRTWPATAPSLPGDREEGENTSRRKENAERRLSLLKVRRPSPPDATASDSLPSLQLSRTVSQVQPASTPLSTL